MNLTQKLGLPLALSLIVVVSTAMGWLYVNTSDQVSLFSRAGTDQVSELSRSNETQISELSQINEKQVFDHSQKNQKQLEKFEIKAAEDLFGLINANLSDEFAGLKRSG